MVRRILAGAALLILPFSAAAQEDALDRGTLRGLKALRVVVDHLDPQLEELGLKRETLVSEIEGRLQRAEVGVDKKAIEFVGLHITSAAWSKKGPYALCLALAVYQPVILARAPDIKTATETWRTDTMLIAQPKVLFESAIDAVDDLADRFTAAFRAANSGAPASATP